jgi:hypothetical protein
MHASFLFAPILALALSTAAQATTIHFDTDPFAGSTALTTPGRQIVGGEPFITFSPLTDTFAFDATAFGITSLNLFNGEASGIPASGVNVVVLRTFDNDANPATAFNAGTAANLIADAITMPGAGFYIYFNQGLDLPRLVYSTDLSDNTADLKILARMTNLTGTGGQLALIDFTAADFVITGVPESSSLGLMGTVLALGALLRVRRRHLRA